MSSPNRAQKSVQSPVAIPANIVAPCVLARATEIDGSSKDLQMGERLTHFQGGFDRPRGLSQVTTIDKLTDDVLLDIFDFYLDNGNPSGLLNVDVWHTLVHVCRWWRNVVFASPRRLNLRLLCRRDRPVRAMLDIWPTLPIVIEDISTRTLSGVGLDNIIAALEHPDRVCSISFYDFPSSAGKALAAKMRVPFPELTHLVLLSEYVSTPVLPLPDSFLGGSAPRLQTLKLCHISFPALPNLLLSATDLVDLSLTRLPHSGYISPEAMVACLSSLNRLKSLQLRFASPLSRPDQPSPPPQTRVVLPALTNLILAVMAKYSEDFFARIDTPVLNQLDMAFFVDPVFDIPHLKQFIDRAKNLKPSKAATLLIAPFRIALELDRPRGSILRIPCPRLGLQVVSMARVCQQLSPFFSLIERLDLIPDYSPFGSQGADGIRSARFLEFFHPFTAVRSLHVSRSLVPVIATALQGLIGEKATDVLPNLRDLFLVGSEIFGTVQETIQPFVTARRLSGRPVVVHHREGSTVDR
ncbi:hypothetical protein BC826DRAFT_1103816 [Russula brevipes]|nr:hypothetical protein BC826DRAFT_1103816 [Russula brevipes]